MSARAAAAAGFAIPRPFRVVVDVELPKDKPCRNKVADRKTFDAARSLAIRVRESFDSFFGEDADFFIIRVIDLRDQTVKFEYN